MSGLGSDYGPRRRGAEHEEQDRGEHASMGNVLMQSADLYSLGRKHKSADVEQLGDLRNYSMGNEHS